MGNFISWLAGISNRQRERDTNRIATKLLDEITDVTDPHSLDPLLADALAERRPPTDAEVRALVDIASKLPLRQRLVLEMSLRDYTPDEIARSLGITKAVAMNELARAMGAMGMKQ